DGRADLVVSDNTSTNLNVYLNNGNGTFAAPVPYSVGAPGDPGSIGCQPLIGDVERVGHPDLVADCPLEGRLLRGNGDGTLQPALTLGGDAGNCSNGPCIDTPKPVKQFQFVHFNPAGVLHLPSVDDQRVTTIILGSPAPQDP